MKKILSLLLVGVMMFSMIPAAYATTDVSNGTNVTYNAADDDTIGDENGDGVADNQEYYTVTVPALLAPGGSGNVTAKGTWASNRQLNVTLKEDTVTLTNTISGGDEKVLDLTFENIALVGSNTAAVSETKPVSVADISAALFGEWTGHFEYNVEMVDVVAATGINIPEGYTLCEHIVAHPQDGTYDTNPDNGLAYVACDHNAHDYENTTIYVVFDDVGYLVEVQTGEVSGGAVRYYGGNAAWFYSMTGNSEFADAPDTGEPFFFYSYDCMGWFYAAEGYEDALLTWTVYANEG